MTYSKHLGDAISYLEAVAIGLRQCKAGELGYRLTEISRNLGLMAEEARGAEKAQPVKRLDQTSPDYNDHPCVLMSYTGQMLDLDED